jgi:hypothetical protein
VFFLSLSLNPDRKPLEMTAEALDDIFSINAEDYRCLVIGLCYFFEDFQTFHFKISGFGHESWPVSHSTELSNFLEVAPDMLEWIKSGYLDEFKLEFYEQGFSMDISLRKIGSLISATINDSSWQPGETRDSISQHDFELAFFEINKLFLKHSVAVFPQIKGLSFFPTIARLCQGEID